MVFDGMVLKIGNQFYRINEQKDEVIDVVEDRIAFIDYTALEIVIKSTLPPRKKFQTLCHEIAHGMLEEHGCREQNNEAFVTHMEAMLTQLLLDNQKLYDMAKGSQ